MMEQRSSAQKNSTLTLLQRVIEMRQVAFESWWAPEHPGWGIIDEAPPDGESLFRRNFCIPQLCSMVTDIPARVQSFGSS